MTSGPQAITSSRIICPMGKFSGHVVIDGAKIKDVIPKGQLPANIPEFDVGDQVVMPGIIDSHVHINEPGRTHWEGFLTASQAAAAGGITTLVDMPLNSSPVTVNVAAFRKKLQAAEGKLYVNCGFWGGYVPGSLSSLTELTDSGVLGIKVFLTDSGLDEFQGVTKKDLQEAMSLMKNYDLPLLAHAEIDAPLAYANPLDSNPFSYQAHLKSRPDSWEYSAIEMLIGLCEDFGTRVHIVHLSSASALELLSRAREHLPVSVETCPHYLFFSSEKIPDNRPEYKCAPPIRNRSNNDKLMQALVNGTIDFVVTDHSPAPPEMKFLETGNLQKAWGGISSLQFLLPVVWTCCLQRGQSLQFVSKILGENTADFLGMGNSKGKIAPGYDADLVIWQPEAEFEVNPELIRYKHPITPYLGQTLKGVVNYTFVNGHMVYDNHTIDPIPRGNILLK
jgi:allantoinase